MTAEKLVFESALEGLYRRALRGKLTPELVAELKQLGLDLGRALPPAVPRDVWFASIELTVKHLYPATPRAEALRDLGGAMMRGIEETLFGKAMAPAVRLLGPRRLLKRLPANVKSANNFSTGVLTEVSANSMRFEVDDNGTAPELFQGSIEHMLRWAGATQVKVTVEPSTPPAASFLISWSD